MDAPEHSAVESQPTTKPACACSRKQHLALAFSVGVCFTLVVQNVGLKWGAPGQPAVALASPGLDLNQARAHELSQVPGLGPRRAQRIVDERESNGRFDSTRDLQRVPGIGERTAGRVQPHVRAGAGPSSHSSTPVAEGSAIHSRTKKSAPARSVNLNTATSAELQQLPGIGAVLAERILAHREEHGPFTHVKELTRIKGIKEKTLEKLLPYIHVENSVAHTDKG